MQFLSLHILHAKENKPVLLTDTQLTFEGIMGFLKENPEVNSLTEFISRLPLAFRSGISIVIDSQGAIQGVSPENPRFIIHGQNASNYRSRTINYQIILAVNRGIPVIEVIEFSSNGFVPHRIEFSSYTPNKLMNVQSPIVDQNLESCLGCHRWSDKEKDREKSWLEKLRAFRPNWEPYPRWRGILGSIHLGSPSLLEVRTLEHLQSIAKSDPLLSLLPIPDDIKNCSLNNTGLSEMLNIMNARRILSQLEQHPEFNENRLAFVAAIMRDDQWFTLLPQWLEADDKKKLTIEDRVNNQFKRNRKKLEESVSGYYALLIESLIKAGHSEVSYRNFGLKSFTLDSITGLLTFSELLFGKKHNPSLDWPMIFKNYANDLPHDYTGGLEGLESVLLHLSIQPVLNNVPDLEKKWQSVLYPINYPNDILKTIHEYSALNSQQKCQSLIRKRKKRDD